LRERALNARDFTNRRPIQTPLTPVDLATNRRKSSVRAKVEHSFLILKHLWGFIKVRYRRLAKNVQSLPLPCWR
jgi:IS5 family transposase